MNMTLVCFSCGKNLNIEVPRLPRFAFELANMANDVGWLGKLDMYRHRSLVFCSEPCNQNALTKSGHYRVRISPLLPKKVR